MEILKILQTVAGLVAIAMILVGSDWVKRYLLSTIR